MREQAELSKLKGRVAELERRLMAQAGACQPATYVPAATGLSRTRPKTAPLRSQGDFQAEARLAALPDSERERLEQLLEGLREYVYDPRSGLSVERREALRILLRRDRQLDLMNPWTDY